MLVRKLRLQRGWSQETLAEMAGVSVRTIQRIERGQVPAIDTAKSLAAVFEVPFAQLRAGEDTMIDTPSNPASDAETDADAATLQDDEKRALEFVKGLKEFYTHAFMYVVFLVTFLVVGKWTEPKLVWGFAGWGVGVILHALVAYEVINWFTPGWEKRMVEKKLGRKL